MYYVKVLSVLPKNALNFMIRYLMQLSKATLKNWDLSETGIGMKTAFLGGEDDCTAAPWRLLGADGDGRLICEILNTAHRLFPTPTSDKTSNQCHLMSGGEVLTEHLDGRCPVRGRGTLFFLPHAPHFISKHVLAANWSPGALSRLMLLSNSWEATFGPLSVLPDSEFEPEDRLVFLPLVRRLMARLGPSALGHEHDDPVVGTAFSNTNLHFFRDLDSLPSELWAATF